MIWMIATALYSVAVDEVAQRVDLSMDSFVSAITSAGDVDPNVVEYLE